MKKREHDAKTPLGQRIVEIARSQGLTSVAALSERSGVSMSTLNDLLYGNTRPVLGILETVCQTLGVEPWQVLAPDSARSPITEHDIAEYIKHLMSDETDFFRIPARLREKFKHIKDWRSIEVLVDNQIKTEKAPPTKASKKA